MATITPEGPWFYLIFYGGFMVFVFIVGLILSLTQKKKGKGKEQKAEDKNQTPSWNLINNLLLRNPFTLISFTEAFIILRELLSLYNLRFTRMHKDLDFIIESGTKKPADITVYALSTCGFCRSALNFLRENDIAFKYIYVDKQSSQVKVQIKKDSGDNDQREEKKKDCFFFPVDYIKKLPPLLKGREKNSQSSEKF